MSPFRRARRSRGAAIAHAVVAVLLVLSGTLASLAPAGAPRAAAQDGRAQPGDGPPYILPTGALPLPDRQTRKAAGDRYIVRLKDGPGATAARTSAMIAAPGVLPTHVYETVFPGFAAYLTPEALERLRQDPNVVAIERDRKLFLDSRADSRHQRRAWRASRGERSAHSAATSDRAPGQKIPLGVQRIGGLNSAIAQIDGIDQRVDVDIAIVDSGIDMMHPDLNVWSVLDCTGAQLGQPAYGKDQIGHGTHVAGTAAAIDNGIGVVGVAPGARIWSIKVIDSSGGLSGSALLCGLNSIIDHATDHGDGLGTIEVANFSVGGPGPVTTCDNAIQHIAFCKMVSLGVTGVVSAGNEHADAATKFPANFAEAITVSAIADKDGKPGGLAGGYTVPCSDFYAYDDALAPFSNYGPYIDIAAPGMEIRSTWPTYLGPTDGFCTGGAYATGNGTSMAAPHVAGVAALLKVEHPDATPEDIRRMLLEQQEPGPIVDDPDDTKEGVVHIPDTTRPSVLITSPRDGATVKSSFTMKVDARDSGSGIATVEFWACSPDCVLLGKDDTAPYALEGVALAAGKSHQLLAWAYDNAGNRGESVKLSVTVDAKQGSGAKPKIGRFTLAAPDGFSMDEGGRLFYRIGPGGDLTLTVEATVKGGAVASVAFPDLLGAPGGEGVQRADAPNLWDFTYRVAPGATDPGVRTITVTSAGGQTASEALIVYQDVHLPTVRITAPKPNRAILGPTWVKAGVDDSPPSNATQSSGVAIVEFWACTPDCVLLGKDDSKPYQVFGTVLQPGQSGELVAWAYDNVGNRGESVRVPVCGGGGCDEPNPGPSPTPTPTPQPSPTPPPPGQIDPDDWRTAELASQLPFSQLLETASLSAGADDPECRELVGGPVSRYEASAWYRVNLPTDAQLHVTTAGSLYQGPDTTLGPVLDTVLLVAVRSGSGWSVLQCADDANGQRTAELTIGIRRATDYYVMAGVFAGGPRKETGMLLVNMDDGGARGREARRR